MDNNENIETPEDNTSFGVQIAKSFALSAAASIGTVAGFIVVGAVVAQVKKVQDNREAKKNQKND